MSEIDFKKTIENLKGVGFKPNPDIVRVSVPNAENVLIAGLKEFLGESARWLPEYKEVAAWMRDNQGKGLLCVGNCGRGKSLICSKVLYCVLSHYHGKIMSVYSAQEMNAKLNEVLGKHIICIDDVGIENESVKYGERRLAFSEVVDEAEKNGHLLFVTTNLTLKELVNKYGERTFDRLKAITKIVQFKGDSLR